MLVVSCVPSPCALPPSLFLQNIKNKIHFSPNGLKMTAKTIARTTYIYEWSQGEAYAPSRLAKHIRQWI